MLSWRSAAVQGINIQPEGFNIAPTGVNVQPQGASISPNLIVIGPYDTTVAGQVKTLVQQSRQTIACTLQHASFRMQQLQTYHSACQGSSPPLRRTLT